MLARGSSGENVKKLQLDLTKLGYNPGTYSGFYDMRTEEAVMLFQMEHNLAVNGVINLDTMELIINLISKLVYNNLH